MADENNAPAPQRTQAEVGRGGRGPQREPGGFRIRLSDNEMRAVRAIQDAFQLRSPVAALGFSVRTLAQMLEQGQLDELVAQQRAAGPGRRPEGPRGDGGGRSGGGRRPWGEERAERGAPRIDPMARPRKPVPVSAPAEAELEPVPVQASDADVAPPAAEDAVDAPLDAAPEAEAPAGAAG